MEQPCFQKLHPSKNTCYESHQDKSGSYFHTYTKPVIKCQLYVFHPG